MDNGYTEIVDWHRLHIILRNERQTLFLEVKLHDDPFYPSSVGVGRLVYLS